MEERVDFDFPFKKYFKVIKTIQNA